MSQPNRIRVTSILKGDDVNDLIKNNIVTLVIKNFYQQELCQKLYKKILVNRSFEKYTHELVKGRRVIQKYFGVDRLGYPFNLTYNSSPESEITAHYYKEAARGICQLREYCMSAVTPIDKLRLELDERFELGATVAAFQGRKMLAGIVRISKEKLSNLSAEQPHFDALPTKFAHLNEQFAANIYLNVPNCGGELELWDTPPVEPLFQTPFDWRASLPTSIKIKPSQGDLIIFNCRRPHAISSFRGTDRVTAQVFIGFQKNKPLQMWN